MLRRTFLSSLLGLAAFLVLVAACGGSGAGGAGGSTGASETIGPAGGVVEDRGVRLTIPEGALTQPVTISVAPAPEIAPADGYRALSPVFLFTPDGLVFQKPAVVEIAFQDDGAGASVVWVSAASGVEDLPSTASAGTVTASVLHFSRGFVGRRDGSVHDADAPDGGLADAPPGDGPSDGPTDAVGDGATCHPATGSCDAGYQCCSGICGGGICAADGAACKGTSQSCDAGAQCCTGVCSTGGVCT
jgi:hypothetical protein